MFNIYSRKAYFSTRGMIFLFRSGDTWPYYVNLTSDRQREAPRLCVPYLISFGVRWSFLPCLLAHDKTAYHGKMKICVIS